jgi:hypothetical protein
MLRHKHMRIDQGKIDRVKKVLKAKTETEAIEKALDRVIEADRRQLKKKRILDRMIKLRKTIGKVHEDSAEWVRSAREERVASHAGGR